MDVGRRDAREQAAAPSSAGFPIYGYIAISMLACGDDNQL